MEKHLIFDFRNFGDKGYAREPVIRKMKNGTLVCLFLTGGEVEPANDNVIKISRSYDDGKTWSVPEVLFSHGKRACWGTEIFCEGDVPFIVLCTYCAESQYIELQTYRSFSYDNGETWTDPVSFPCGVNGVSVRQGIKLSNGDWLFPVYWQESPYDFDWSIEKPHNPEKIRFRFCSGVMISSDEGKTFSRYGYLKDDRALWEPNCIEAEPGHILYYLRNNTGYLYFSESFDYGRTFSEPITTNIPNADTKITLLKIENHLLMINNFNNVPEFWERKNLEIRISDDNGKSWRKAVELEAPDEPFFYPHAFADDNGKTLYVAYENMREHYIKKISYSELGI